MGIRYDGLFTILKAKKMSKTGLQKRLGLSSTTIAKLSKNESISLKVIEDICTVLNCQPGDILKLVNEDEENKLLIGLRSERVEELRGGIYHQTQIKLAYNSTRLEENRLSEDEIRTIYETNTLKLSEGEVVNVDTITDAINHFQCFDYLLDVAEATLDEDMIMELHRILKNNTTDSRSAGYPIGSYKKEENSFAGMETEKPQKVRSGMEDILLSYAQNAKPSLFDIIDFHYSFEMIHPFQTGSGAVGRMIMFKECLKNNITPFIIEESEKSNYLEAFKNYKKNKKPLREICTAAQEHYKELMEYFLQT